MFHYKYKSVHDIYHIKKQMKIIINLALNYDSKTIEEK